MIKNITIRSLADLARKQQNHYVYQGIVFLTDFLVPENLESIYLSFNGGKDATVVLYLTLIALENSGLSGKKLKCLYFDEPDSFEQIEKFILSIQQDYPIELIHLKSKNYPKELQQFAILHPLHYIIMGTRKDDPHCSNLGRISSSDSDKGYPHFVRLNPIFDWTYQQVWQFIKNFGIPYCKLYDEGYTYLGNKKNTIKNPLLYNEQAHKYLPASEGASTIQTKSRMLQSTDKTEQK